MSGKVSLAGNGNLGPKVRILVIGVVLMAAAWLADAAIDSFFEQESFLSNIFAPELHEALIRGVFLASQFGFLIYISRLFTRQHRLQAELKSLSAAEAAERRRCENILEVLGDGISIQDSELRILYQNALHRQMMGDHLGEYCYRAYRQQETVCPGCQLVTAFSDGRVHVHESERLGEEGRRIVEIISSPLRDSSGKVIAGIEAVRDITARKLLEERLRAQMAAMESSIDGIGILDAAAHYTYLNRAHAELYGYDRPEVLLGRSWRDLYEADEVARFEQSILPELFREGRWRGEASGRRRDGSLFPQELSLSVLADGGIVCVVRDITRRHQALAEIRQVNRDLEQRTAELQSANRELEAFGYSLSHDLRSFLTKISAAAQLLEVDADSALSATGSNCLETILTAIDGMDDLIQAMLVISQVSRKALRIETVDLSELAAEVVLGLRLGDPGRPVEVVIAPDLVARGDRQLLRVVLDNLIGNAWKYSGGTRQPRIEFGRTEQEGQPVFVVRDNGRGFDMNEASRLFHPFQRLSNVGEIPGTGIGLATVARVIQRHGGAIWAEGSAKGAVFYFTLP